MPTYPIYLDYQSTAPIDPRVREAVFDAFSSLQGNPSSTHHPYGKAASDAVEAARSEVAQAIDARPHEVIFTSGATEANNLALIGLAEFLQENGRRQIVSCVTEHKCVLESLKYLERKGFTVTLLGVDEQGEIDLEALRAALGPETGLVSLMAANNEIGVLHPLPAIARLCREHGALFHTDAAQAIGKVPFSLAEIGADLVSISSHKLYGPIGLGALYVRSKHRRKLSPLLHGGGQERGLRSGTVPSQLCVGFGEACRIAVAEMPEEARRLEGYRNRLLDRLQGTLEGVEVNGGLDRRLPGNLNLGFAAVDAEALIMKVRDRLAISSGSACSASSLEPSYVIRALGLCPEHAESAVRISLGRFTTQNDVDVAADILIQAVTSMRQISNFGNQPHSADSPKVSAP